MYFKEKTHSELFFFPPCSLSKGLICIRLSRVMTFRVINVTSIIPPNISCLRLQNVNVSDYMAVTRDPEERGRGSPGVGAAVGPLASSGGIHCHGFGKTFTQCQKYDTGTHARTRTRRHTAVCILEANAIQQTLGAHSFGKNRVKVIER